MNRVPKDSELYERFEKGAEELLPKSLMPYFEEEIYDLVTSFKDVISYILSEEPDRKLDIDGQIRKKLELWCNDKERYLQYKGYKDFLAKNGISNRALSSKKFFRKGYFEKWSEFLKLGVIEKGSLIRVKGYGDLCTVRGVSAYISVAVEEFTDKHFNPDQIVEVVVQE